MSRSKKTLLSDDHAVALADLFSKILRRRLG
jgi:hypothetical protein